MQEMDKKLTRIGETGTVMTEAEQRHGMNDSQQASLCKDMRVSPSCLSASCIYRSNVL